MAEKNYKRRVSFPHRGVGKKDSNGNIESLHVSIELVLEDKETGDIIGSRRGNFAIRNNPEVPKTDSAKKGFIKKELGKIINAERVVQSQAEHAKWSVMKDALSKNPELNIQIRDEPEIIEPMSFLSNLELQILTEKEEPVDEYIEFPEMDDI